MKIVPLGADSLGTRSFSFYIETPDIKIVIDPSCALAPRRYSLPPTPDEIENLNRTYKKIREHVKKSDAIIITHYHNDHYPFFDTEVFKEKFLLLKNYSKNMNHMQIVRGKRFCDELKNLKIEFDFCDGKKYRFGETVVVFSDGLWHGKLRRQGKCVAVIIKERGESAFFSSDTQGLWEDRLRKFIEDKNINYFFIDGPSLYQSKKSDIDEFFNQVSEILKNLNDAKIIIDHHFIRDLNYKNYIKRLKDVFGERIFTCAGFCGVSDTPLEALRRDYYEKKNHRLN